MNVEIILTVLLFMYWLGEAATEAFTHMNDQQRIENPVIRSGWRVADGCLDYHTWRTIEYLGIIGTILYLLPSEIRWFYIGMTLIAWFFYQRLLGYTRKGELFPYKSPYNIGRFGIPHPLWLDWVALVVGFGIVIWDLYNR